MWAALVLKGAASDVAWEGARVAGGCVEPVQRRSVRTTHSLLRDSDWMGAMFTLEETTHCVSSRGKRPEGGVTLQGAAARWGRRRGTAMVVCSQDGSTHICVGRGERCAILATDGYNKTLLKDVSPKDIATRCGGSAMPCTIYVIKMTD